MLDKKKAITPIVRGAGIILAAGKSQRLRVGETLPKQLIQIFDKRLLDYSQMLITDLQNTFLVATKECYSENIWGIPDENLILLSHPTDSQIASVRLGLTLKILPNEPVSFLSSDNIIAVEDSLALSNSLANADVCIWTCENYPIARIQPDEYSWVKVNDENFIEEFLYKSKPDNYHSWKMVTGNFSFKNKAIATLLITQLTNSRHPESKEIMLDNVILLAIKQNLRIRSFDLENYLTLGSSIEEQVFNYWNN
jgi:dTDP-glucose pyrophosphorylase